MTHPTCSTCRHHDPERNWCRAAPPRVIDARRVDSTQPAWQRPGISTVWPVVQPDDWCASHRPAVHVPPPPPPPPPNEGNRLGG